MSKHEKHGSERAADQGRWTSEEHELFLQGMMLHGREWKKVQAVVRTRTSAQIRSHAQKYFQKMAKTKNVSSASSQNNIGEDAFATLEYMEYIHCSLRRCLGVDPDINGLLGGRGGGGTDMGLKMLQATHGVDQIEDDDEIGSRKDLKRKSDEYEGGSSSDTSSVTERTDCPSSDDNDTGNVSDNCELSIV